MNSIKLNQLQIKKLFEIAKAFPHTEHFVLEAHSPSGIGMQLDVRFDLFEPRDAVVDITDVESW